MSIIRLTISYADEDLHSMAGRTLFESELIEIAEKFDDQDFSGISQAVEDIVREVCDG